MTHTTRSSSLPDGALPSIVPLQILTLIGLSHVVDQVALLKAVRRCLEWLLPDQSQTIDAELARLCALRRTRPMISGT